MNSITQGLSAGGLYKKEQPRITVVSGLPRSGTSMMMRMLEAGGMQVVVDEHRTADENNPLGYYEFSGVNNLAEGDCEWLKNAVGKALKVVSARLQGLPDSYNYKVIFLQRALHEVVASQRLLLESEGKPADFEDDEMAVVFREHISKVMLWLADQPNMDVIYIDYNEVLQIAGKNLAHIPPFLGQTLDLDRMLAVIEARLYRNRQPAVLRADRQ